MKLDLFEKLGIAIGITWLVLLLTVLAGYVSNLVWLVGNASSDVTARLIVALLGAVVPTLGIFHGIFSWFG